LLYRVFAWDRRAGERAAGGPLFNPRAHQGAGRHDNPEFYGAIYCSGLEVSSIAEWLAPFRGRAVSEVDLRRTDGRELSVVAIDDTELDGVQDLDDPQVLAARVLRPSLVATHDRPVTQEIARRLYDEGVPGISWWSTLEARWPNVTLFAERALENVSVAEGPRPLAVDDAAFVAAARAIGVVVDR
jgi:hypothetical protein